MSLDLLAIAAHPDDVEITCGGTVIKAVDAGKKVGIIDLTRGEMGTYGTADQRLEEAQAAAKIMGVSMRENLSLPDSALDSDPDAKVKIAARIREYRPTAVLLPYRDGQRHPDHRVTADLAYDAIYLSGLKKAPLDGEPFRPKKIIYASSYIETIHSFFVDVSAQYERKVEAVRAYKSQSSGFTSDKKIFKPGNDIFELMDIYHRKYGIGVGVRYAEAFVVTESILIDDITAMPVQSI